ncbi:Golgi to ER traffic protein 4, partial [Tetrabaena socialis]
TLARIKGSVESGAYYEAQQMYKSSFHRSKARQQLDDAFTILQEGAVTQLAHGQVTCGVELGMLLVEAYTSTATPADRTSVARLLAVINAFPAPSTGAEVPGQGGKTPSLDECARLVATAAKWAHRGGAVMSVRRIHSAFASYLWKSYGADAIGRALPHFVRGEDSTAFATALHTCALRGPALEVLGAATSDSRMAQLAYARSTYDDFLELHGAMDTPTAHLTELVLLALEHLALSPRAHAMFVLARERYSDGVLRRDDSLAAMLERVEALYFNVRRGGDGGGLGGLLGNLLKSFA